jgi:hypothetical protein
MRSPRLIITAHAAVRRPQRGYRVDDFATVEMLGTYTDDGILVRKKDVQTELLKLSKERRSIRRQQVPNRHAEQEIIRQQERLRRLIGTFIPMEGRCALSIYRPCIRRLKHILHGRTGRRFQKRWS